MVCVGTVYRPYVTVTQLRENRWSALSFQDHEEDLLRGVVPHTCPFDYLKEPFQLFLGHRYFLQARKMYGGRVESHACIGGILVDGAIRRDDDGLGGIALSRYTSRNGPP